MSRSLVITAVLLGLLAGCDDAEDAPPPPPAELTRAAIGHYDHMVVLDHEGPKAQIHLESREEPVWFSSVRDAFAFSMLPEEPRDIAAIYVSDMGRAASWADPGPDTWIEARDADFVIGSRMRGGMGAEEPVPFDEEEAARAFAAEHGGEVVPFAEVPKDYVLGATATAAAPPGEGHAAPGGAGGASAHSGQNH
jgi:copper chaperone NosL